MDIHYADRTISRIDDIESGIVFKYDNDFYIATTHYDFDAGKDPVLMSV